MWLKLSLEASIVLALRKGLRGSREMFLPYRQMRTFFALGSRGITARRSILEEDDVIVDMVHLLLEELEVIDTQETAPTSPDLSPSTWATVFKTLISRMDSLIEQNNRRAGVIKDAWGPCAVGESLDVISGPCYCVPHPRSSGGWLTQGEDGCRRKRRNYQQQGLSDRWTLSQQEPALFRSAACPSLEHPRPKWGSEKGERGSTM